MPVATNPYSVALVFTLANLQTKLPTTHYLLYTKHMRIVVLYHPKSEQGGLIEDFVRDFERFKAKKLEPVSLETIEGSDLARLYDITAYPAVLVMRDNGSLLRLWQGMPLPLMDELSYYTKDQEIHSYSGSATYRNRVIQPLPAAA